MQESEQHDAPHRLEHAWLHAITIASPRLPILTDDVQHADDNNDDDDDDHDDADDAQHNDDKDHDDADTGEDMCQLKFDVSKGGPARIQ